MSVQRFEIDVSDDVLSALHARLATTRHADDGNRGAGDDRWAAGGDPEYLRALVDHWHGRYDLRARVAEINRLSQYVAEIGEHRIHFVHERGPRDGALPIVLTHGYPDSFLRFQKLIPMLADPAAFGGDPADAFDVVVPSLPGFAFSRMPSHRDSIFHVADLWHTLMAKTLGYARYAAHGGDWGSIVTEHLGRSHAHSVIGIHLTDVPFWHTFQKPSDASPSEKTFFEENERFQHEAGAYAMIQGTRPKTLADGLADSPAGLAAWMVEKFARWSDCDGDLDSRFTKDELLDHVMLYWTTASIGTSFFPYYDMLHAGVGHWILEKLKEVVLRSHVPAGFALFPKDLSHPPREWADRFFQVERWTSMPRGGHFAAMEEPDLLARDLREFFRPLRRRLARS
jgi:microsomal epoxide hydrolase